MATNQMRREAAKRKLERQQERRAQQAQRRKRVAVIAAVVTVVALVIGLVLWTTLGRKDALPPEPKAAGIPPQSIPTAIAPLSHRPTALPALVNCTYPAATDGPAAKPNQPPVGASISTQGTVPVTLETSAGTVPLTLDRALAPCTVNSFVSLAQQGYFDNTPCHRLTTNPTLQVLQCGDPSGTGSGGPGYTIPDEVFPELTYGRGVLAMAKTPSPNSGGSQFFMVYGDGQLPPEYTAFGSISPEGLTVIDGIARKGYAGSPEDQSGDGAPVEPVTIKRAVVS